MCLIRLMDRTGLTAQIHNAILCFQCVAHKCLIQVNGSYRSYLRKKRNKKQPILCFPFPVALSYNVMPAGEYFQNSSKGIIYSICWWIDCVDLVKRKGRGCNKLLHFDSQLILTGQYSCTSQDKENYSNLLTANAPIYLKGLVRIFRHKGI